MILKSVKPENTEFEHHWFRGILTAFDTELNIPMRLPHPLFSVRLQVGAFILTKEQEASWQKDSLCHFGCSQASPFLLPSRLGTDSQCLLLFAFLSLGIHESCIHMALHRSTPGGLLLSQPHLEPSQRDLGFSSHPS